MEIKKIIQNNQGLTLFEVLIAFTMFAVFFMVFVSSQSDNLIDSRYMSEELKLHNLCENVINDILFSPPPLTPALTLKKETKSFEDENLSDFEYTVEYAQFELPNIFDILPKGEEEDDEPQSGAEAQAMKLIFDQIKNNVLEALWQVKVSVKNKESNSTFTLISWIRNPQYQIKTELPNLGGGATGLLNQGANSQVSDENGQDNSGDE